MKNIEEITNQERTEHQENNGDPEYLLCSAIWVKLGEYIPHQPFNIPYGLVMCGWNHPQIIQQIDQVHKFRSCFKTQGFLTNKNRFLTRKESLVVARSSGQVAGDLIGGVLTSEDLWVK